MNILETISAWFIALPWATIAAVVSAGVAVLLYVGNRRSARQRDTINFLENRRQADIHSRHYLQFLELISRNEDLSRLAPTKASKSSQQATALIWMTNHYELVATCIHEGLFDEAIYFRQNHSTVMRDWYVLLPYINAVRQPIAGDGLELQYYCEFEKLAKRWSNFDSWHKHTTWLGNLLKYKLWWRRRSFAEFREFGNFK